QTEAVITHEFTSDRAQEAFDLAKDSEVSGKVVVSFCPDRNARERSGNSGSSRCCSSGDVKLVITDSDHPSLEDEKATAEAGGVELVISQATEPADVIEAAQGADGLVVQYAQISAEVLDHLPGVRAIGRYGVGVDTVDVAAATQRGVAVCNVPDYGTEAVSDHAITLALAVTRGLRPLDMSVRNATPGLTQAVPIPQFSTLNFGVRGYGRIGDRKSTRLNSSHVSNSYAVFCLK